MSEFDKDEFWDSGLSGLDFEEIDESKPNRVKKFFAGSGFYLVLALCVAAVGGVAAWTVNDSMKTAETSQAPTRPVVTTAATTKVEAAGHAVATVPDVRVTTKPTTAKTTATTALPAKDTFALPLTNAVVRGYGDAPIYWETLDTWRVHHAVDYAGKEGATVKAAASGTVTKVYEDALWGGCVTVDHRDGTTFTYRGVKCSLATDAAVKVGEPIGVLCEIPCEKELGFHLHLEMTADDRVVDPAAAMGIAVKEVEPTKAE